MIMQLAAMRFALSGLDELGFLPSAAHWAVSLSTVGARDGKVNCYPRFPHSLTGGSRTSAVHCQPQALYRDHLDHN